MVIENLVISGGGPTGFVSYGAMYYLHKKNYWNIKNIKSIYSCSVGSWLAVLISLRCKWSIIKDYIIKRPWITVVESNSKSLLDSYMGNGLLNIKFVYETIRPLFESKNLSKMTTMQDFYNFNGIELHLFTTKISKHNMKKIDISYKTHPNLPLIVALNMSVSFPVLFEPVLYKKQMYIDGGILNNFPLNDCIDNVKDENTILAFKNVWVDEDSSNSIVSIKDYIYYIVRVCQSYISSDKNQKKIKQTVYCIVENMMNMDEWISTFKCKKHRYKLYKSGKSYARLYLNYQRQ